MAKSAIAIRPQGVLAGIGVGTGVGVDVGVGVGVAVGVGVGVDVGKKKHGLHMGGPGGGGGGGSCTPLRRGVPFSVDADTKVTAISVAAAASVTRPIKSKILRRAGCAVCPCCGRLFCDITLAYSKWSS